MSNRATVTIDTKTAESIFSEISLIEKRLSVLRKKVMEFVPASYGSDAWWEKEIEGAQQEIKEGKYTVYNNAHDLIKDLHAGK